MPTQRNGRKEIMLDQLRAFTPEKLDFDEMVALYSFGVILKSSYANFIMEVPEWVSTNLTALEKEINDRRRDTLQKELKRIDLGLEGLKSKEEKRTELEARGRRLREQLAK